ncbi:MAG TPA: histidine kinase [Gaiellaceae bacterium]|nr:histidine kinase [Gaiellaceae bacterium]
MRIRPLPPRLDLLLGAAVAALALVEVAADGLTPYAASVPAAIVQAAAVAWRRRAPLPAVAAGSGAMFVQTAAGVSLHTPVMPIVVGLITVYSVAQYERLERAAAGLGVALAASLAAIQLAQANGERYGVADRLFVALFVVAPWIVGRALHGRTLEAAEQAARAEALEREQERAVEEERGRIARELHDVVAHSLGVIVVQAGAGERVAAQSPERALAALRSIQEIGRQALGEMSRLVGVLREGGEEIGLEPQPGLERLEELLEQTRLAGLAVELTVAGEPARLPPGADLSAYRIVQEALTNARKHGGESAAVSLRYDQDRLAIEVVDPGGGPGRNGGGGGGHGLIGMRERAALYGGTLEAGRREDGGFAVRATIPLRSDR